MTKTKSEKGPEKSGPEQHTGHRQWLHDIAEKIEGLEALSAFDAHCAAAVIRAFADMPAATPARGRGRPRTFSHHDALALFDALRSQQGRAKGWTHEKAIAYVAELFRVNEETVESAVDNGRKQTPAE